MSAEIDRLEVKITASATSATKSLQALATSLEKVKTALSGVGKDGLKISDHVSRNLREMDAALHAIDVSGIERLRELTSALNDYVAACRNLKSVGSLGSAAKDMQKLSSAATKPAPTDSVVNPTDTRSDEGVSGGGSETVDIGSIKEHTSFLKILSEEFQVVKDRTKDAGRRMSEWTKNIKIGNGAVKTFLKSIARIALYRAIRSAIKAVSEAFGEGLRNAYLFSKQKDGIKRLADTLDRLKSITSQMVNQIGAMWGEIKQLIMPAIEWIVDKVRWLAEKLTELFAAFNGSDYYKFAKYQSLEWDEATESVKKYKQQLLGLDELNNLSSNDNKASDEVDKIKEAFEDKPVSEQFKQYKIEWDGLLEKIKKKLEEYHDLFVEGGVGLVALGTILLFVPTKRALGLGLIFAGISLVSIAVGVKFGWDDILKKIKEKFKAYKKVFKKGAVAAVALGMILLFVPGQRALGLGLILGGSFLDAMADNIDFSWGGLLKKIKQRFQDYKDLLLDIGAPAAVAIGTMLLFVPGKRALGLGLILAGVTLKSLTKDDISFSWEGLKNKINKKFEEYAALFNAIGWASTAMGTMLLFVPGKRALGLGLILAGTAIKTLASEEELDLDSLLNSIKEQFESIKNLFKWGGIGATALGAILLFVPGMRGLGWELIKAGLPGVFVALYDIDWGSVLEKLKNAWGDIKIWWNNTVMNGIREAVAEVEKWLNIDINNDGKIGFAAKTELHKSSSGDVHGGTYGSFDSGDTTRQDSTENRVLSLFGLDIYEIVEDSLADKIISLFSKKAVGGVVRSGELFVSGEVGSEIVGKMGSNTAVANTGQMTDAIYKAAYMGMSQALKEHGGNGMSGWEPATTDDLFVAMKRKASNYNKRTGSPAFA